MQNSYLPGTQVTKVLLWSYKVDALGGPLHFFLAAKTDQCAAMWKKIDVKLNFFQGFFGKHYGSYRVLTRVFQKTLILQSFHRGFSKTLVQRSCIFFIFVK